MHTADLKLKSIWPNLKRGKKFVGTLYVLSVVTPQIRSMEFFKASTPLAQSMELMTGKQFFTKFSGSLKVVLLTVKNLAYDIYNN